MLHKFLIVFMAFLILVMNDCPAFADVKGVARSTQPHNLSQLGKNGPSKLRFTSSVAPSSQAKLRLPAQVSSSSQAKLRLPANAVPSSQAKLRLPAKAGFPKAGIGHSASKGKQLTVKPTDGSISSAYGMRKLSKKRKARMHTGIDIRAQRGTPVVASGAGVVSFVGSQGAYGKMVKIDHGNGLVTLYAHLDTFTVKEGQRLAAGENLGTVGRTGRTTGANLHFETSLHGKVVNPVTVAAWDQNVVPGKSRSQTQLTERSVPRRTY